MHEIFRPRGSLITLMSELADERTTVALCRDRTPSVVWINITSVGDEPRHYCVSGGMKMLPAGEHFVAAGVIDPPGSIGGVELQLLGGGRYAARICPEGWLLILPPGTGGYRQRATFRYRSGKSVESAILPPAGMSLDSGGTRYAPL